MSQEKIDDLLDVMVVFQSPPGGDQPAEPGTEGERYNQLISEIASMRENVVDHLEELGLRDEASLPETTAFNVLPARATPRAIEVIKESSDVVDVKPLAGDLPVDLAS